VSACTIVARNYLAHARVLAASYARHHPGRRLSVLVTDGHVDDGMSFAPASEPFEIILPHELPLDGREYRRMASIYDVTELATALKAVFLQHLLDRDRDAVVYLDPDIEIFAPLDELDRLAREHGIVLIPHMLRPIPSDGRKPSFADVAASGVYNLGFIAVDDAARPWLEWWGERLRRDCLMAPQEGMFVDQRFIDFLPAFFAPCILRDPAYNVAYWNLHERRVTWTGARYEVAGRPLRFFHFSGFSPLQPHRLSKHQGTAPRIVLADEPDLARLCHDYAARVLGAGFRQCAAIPYGFSGTAHGVPLDRRMRRLYREGLLAAERGVAAEPPCPLDPAEAKEFVEWVRHPQALEALPPRSRAALLIQEGPYLGSRNPLVRAAQWALLRLLRPLLLHDQRVGRALLQGVDEVAAERDGAAS
jgi:hypothetical protein